MKRLALLILFFAIPAYAAHQVVLTWTASSDSTTANPGTVTVYRASGACPATNPASLTYIALTTTAPAGGPYTDSTATLGQWCYYATDTISGATSVPSNYFTATVTPGAVTITAAVAQ